TRFPALERVRLEVPDTIPIVHQTTATDCGAACLAMVLGYFGRHLTLEAIRRSMSVGRDGVSARAILEAASVHGLFGRGVQIELADLPELPKGSILHIGFSHFVVFERCEREGVHIVDPAFGRRVMPPEEARREITGVALLFEPAAGFTKTAKPQNPVIRHLRTMLGEKKTFARIASMSLALQLTSLMFPLAEGRIADRVLPRNDDHLMLVLIAGLAATIAFYFGASIIRAQLLL